MTFWHTRSKRKPTGGQLTTPWNVKKKAQRGSEATKTSIGEKQIRSDKATGANLKFRAMKSNVASVLDPKTGKSKKAQISDVLENAANPHYKRMKVITKGAIIQTSEGRARVTSRPGQNGTINAIKTE